MAAQSLEIDHVEADAVLGDHAKLGDRTKNAIIDPFQRRDRLVVSAQKRHQSITCQTAAVFIERHVRMARQKFGAQHQMPRERSRCYRDAGQVLSALNEPLLIRILSPTKKVDARSSG